MIQAETPAGAGLPAPDAACSAASVWRLVSAGISEALVPAQERFAVCRGLALLPPLSAMIVERPLGGVAPGIDVSLCATPADGLPAWPPHAAWLAVRDFYLAWLVEDSGLRRSIPSIWLEFDGSQLESAQPAPCFFANMRKLGDAQDRLGAAAGILKIFVAPDKQEATAGRLETLLHRLPPHAHLDFLGFMLARATASTRICLSMPSRELLDFLGRTGYDVDPQLYALAQLAVQHSDRVVLHLNLDTGPGSMVGIELQPEHGDGWPALLAALESEGLCNAQERTGLLAFPRKAGIVRAGGKLTRPNQLSCHAPERWANADAFAFARRLNHVKLVCEPGQAPAAKAYLRIDYKWKCREGLALLDQPDTNLL